ncbi:hypothetical protein K474DRAFT_196510 [Panus rudis PR-1116 ss-1]|nr:hypothetical protein K474DRAFT_196510 [Panus rudis PR-1116 ss-1]
MYTAAHKFPHDRNKEFNPNMFDEINDTSTDHPSRYRGGRDKLDWLKRREMVPFFKLPVVHGLLNKQRQFWAKYETLRENHEDKAFRALHDAIESNPAPYFLPMFNEALADNSAWRDGAPTDDQYPQLPRAKAEQLHDQERREAEIQRTGDRIAYLRTLHNAQGRNGGGLDVREHVKKGEVRHAVSDRDCDDEDEDEAGDDCDDEDEDGNDRDDLEATTCVAQTSAQAMQSLEAESVTYYDQDVSRGKQEVRETQQRKARWESKRPLANVDSEPEDTSRRIRRRM